MSDINYQCSVVRIQSIHKHPNADRLQLTTIYGNTVIVGADVKVGDLGLFFPLESQIGEEFALRNDLIRRKGPDGKPAGGMFDNNRRVRAQKLRGVPSMGFFIELSSLNYLCPVNHFPSEGEAFNELMGRVISKKYIPKCSTARQKANVVEKKTFKRYLKEHFKEHFDTEHLFRNLDFIPNNTEMIVTLKLHGTSLRCGNVLVRRKLSVLEKFLKFLGIKIQETEYDFLVGSRTVIKDSKEKTGFYERDLWTEVSNSYFKDKLHKGEMIYAEVVGYVPGTQSLIQKPYTYGCKIGECKVFVYRISITNPDGTSFDLSWEQLKARCNELGIDYVPEAIDKYGKYKWLKHEYHETLIADIRDVLLEKPCVFQPELPEEGVCFRIEEKLATPRIYKAKSFAFLEIETKQLDENEVDLETINS